MFIEYDKRFREEPDALIGHVRVCGGLPPARAVFYPESYIKDKYQEIYRCPICGEVVTERPVSCPICGSAGDTFVVYQAQDNLKGPCMGSHSKGQMDCDEGCNIKPPSGKTFVNKDFDNSCKQPAGVACNACNVCTKKTVMPLVPKAGF